MRGKPWTVDEERQLRQLVLEGKNFSEISIIMGKTRLSVKGKMFNSGLNSLIVATSTPRPVATTIATTTSLATSATTLMPAPVPISVNVVDVDLKLPERLPSIEEELKILSAAVEDLRQPGLNPSEASRLYKVIQGVNVYQKLFADFVNYCGLEAEVLELRRQLASERNGTSEAKSSSVSR